MDRLKGKIMFVVPVLVAVLASCRGTPERATCREILAAIRIVESGGRDNPSDGDGGRAIGPFQIHRPYWQEATEFDPSIGGSYEDCRDRAYSEKVVAAYMRRHVPAAWKEGDAEAIARTHNGGPKGAAKAATTPYWEKVRAVLEGQRRRGSK